MCECTGQMCGSHGTKGTKDQKTCSGLNCSLNYDMVTGEDKNAEPEDQQLHWGADVQKQF